MADTDYIVVGGGHNGLVCAAYLAKAGQRVLVLEMFDILGGYNTTEEIEAAPGYKLNVGALEHIGILEEPFMQDLDLKAHGLDYIDRDEAYLFPFLDGTDIPFYSSIERTSEEIGKLSAHDAEVYRPFMEFSDAFLGHLGRCELWPPSHVWGTGGPHGCRGWPEHRQGALDASHLPWGDAGRVV